MAYFFWNSQIRSEIVNTLTGATLQLIQFEPKVVFEPIQALPQTLQQTLQMCLQQTTELFPLH